MKQDIQTIASPTSIDKDIWCRLQQLESLNVQLEQERNDFNQRARQLELSQFDLTERFEKSEADNQRLQAENEQLYGLIRLMKQEKFGRSSEKQKHLPKELPILPGMEQVFAESQRKQKEEAAKIQQTESSSQETTNVQGYERKKTGRKPLPKNLPREEVIHDISESEKVCACGCQMSRIGEERSEQLEHVPAVFKVIEHVRYKYACKTCEENVKIAPVPAQPIPKSMAAPGLLSYILVAKFEDHLPFYRQSKIWKRHGVDLSRNTMCNWAVRCAELLSPLVDLLKQDIVSHDYVQADETTIQVLKEPGRKATTKSYMWAYKTQGKDQASIVYEYQPTRGGEAPANFLQGFAGYLQTDAYQGYNKLAALASIIWVLCWAHARRKFFEVLKMTNGKSGKAQKAVDMIAELYAVEEEAKLNKLPPDKVKELRQQKSKPILEKFKLWLDEQVLCVPPKNPLGKAIRYVLNHWQGLTRYLDDGRLSIDNNMCENKVRPFALGRKNWLFNDTVRGVKAAAVIYSLIETCKANGVNTFDYLNHVLKEIPKLPEGADLTHLLPWNVKLGA